ncbi:hypothetical protein [Thermomonospora umbrina]|uniref:Tetratricopeptide repeat protein n=1 Tax=Thermomonospora umbrina TaxID=111806 RepID=A0A3D9SZ28_9ACTN|nr:hypothetical protein [Thermomonospora umbrina]REF01197.1 hypothetical protein DFJ69_6798 [Thermomonospora umbrina]
MTGEELDAEARVELRTLPKDLAAKVARHLVMTGRLIDEDPATAYRHAQAARRLASRVGIVREATGLAAYYAGEWSEALGELRAARRLRDTEEAYLPILADCERGLGRPERALDLAKSPAARKLDTADRVELRIVESGARRDLGQYDAAVVALQMPELRDKRLQPWTARLFYAYADALLATERKSEASEWFARAAAADREDETDAAERYAELEGLEIIDLEEAEGDSRPDLAEPSGAPEPEAHAGSVSDIGETPAGPEDVTPPGTDAPAASAERPPVAEPEVSGLDEAPGSPGTESGLSGPSEDSGRGPSVLEAGSGEPSDASGPEESGVDVGSDEPSGIAGLGGPVSGQDTAERPLGEAQGPWETESGSEEPADAPEAEEARAPSGLQSGPSEPSDAEEAEAAFQAEAEDVHEVGERSDAAEESGEPFEDVDGPESARDSERAWEVPQVPDASPRPEVLKAAGAPPMPEFLQAEQPAQDDGTEQEDGVASASGAPDAEPTDGDEGDDDGRRGPG